MMDSAASFSAQRPSLCGDFTGKERDAETGLDSLPGITREPKADS